MNEFDKQKKEKEENIAKVKAILKENNIEMDIGGCGCCDSPWVTFKHNGEEILDEDDCNFTMIEEEKK